MDRAAQKLTVFFEDPFWVGVFERRSEGKLSVCRVTFGAEPRDYEINEFIRKGYWKLRFSPALADGVKEAARNPKRILRQARRQAEDTGIGTKSQQALKLQQELRKTERRTVSRQRREEERQRQFELKQYKKKEKHRGR